MWIGWLVLIGMVEGILYSKHYGRCELWRKGTPMGEMKMDTSIGYKYDGEVRTHMQKNVTAEDFDFLVVDTIGAGGSGEVFLVEELGTAQQRILKRYYQTDQLEHERENYIMSMLEIPHRWHTQNNKPGEFQMVSFPTTNSKDLNKVKAQNLSLPFIMYKACQQIGRLHQKGIVHYDLKSNNMLVVEGKDVQIIDWNLAFFYYPGMRTNFHSGTPCFYSPEVLLQNTFLTPALDIWSLGLALYRLASGGNFPFPLTCSEGQKNREIKLSNLQAITSLVGSAQMLKFISKHSKLFYSRQTLLFLEKLKKDPTLYSGISLMDRVEIKNEKYFTDELVDLLEGMLQVDPEKRLTIQEVLNHRYFDKVKKLPPLEKFGRKELRELDEKVVPANNRKLASQ